ncbi:unnamed protein product [Penicillium manginii]
MTLDQIKRYKNCDAPYISEIIKALYESNFDLDWLRIRRPSTSSNTSGIPKPTLVSHGRMTSHSPGISAPRNMTRVGYKTREEGRLSPLGAFGRGHRRIQPIVTWLARFGGFSNLRFDIEVVQ